MFRTLYDICMHVFAFPVAIRAWLRGQRSIKSYFCLSGNRADIWIHAVSVGEARAAIPIVKWLKATYPELKILMTSVTKTGREEVRRSLPEVDYSVYLPLDLSWVMRRAVKKVEPKLLIITETDYWYRLMDEVKRQGGKILVINGKLSERSAKFYRRFPMIFDLVDHFCVQDEVYRTRFGRGEVTGNLKLGVKPPEFDPGELRTRLKLSPHDRIITVGSTHDPEEREILKALDPLLSDYKILLVPRHPERFEQVAKMLEGSSFGRYSQELTGDERVILIDAMGVLLPCYQISDIAIVAGSFTDRIGGHNIIEPLWYGVPVIFGPYMHSQTGLKELVLGHGAGLQVPLEDLEQVIDRMDREKLKAGGASLLASTKGAVERTCQKIRGLIESGPS